MNKTEHPLILPDLSLDAYEPSQEETEVETDPFDRLLDEFIAQEKERLSLDDDYFTDGAHGDNDTAENAPEEDDDATVGPDCEETPATVPLYTGPLLSPLDHLTGLKAVKEKLTVYEKLVRFNKMRHDCGMPVSPVPLHAMFLGSPGTGKTTVAKMMGLMLARAGVLSRGHVVVKERATLLGPNYSMEETNTLKAIEEAQGGILLIDEAYQLYQPDDPRDPGKFVIETLLTALADDSSRDWMLILAGYPEEMKRMFRMNPGFESRIPQSNIYVFDDFTATELMEIAEKYLARHQYTLTPEARDALSARLSADYSRRDRTFGNARHVVNLIQTAILPAMAVRVVSSDPAGRLSLSEIQASDIPLAAKPVCPPRERIGFRA